MDFTRNLGIFQKSGFELLLSGSLGGNFFALNL